MSGADLGARRRSIPLLERVAFKTSRLAEFCSIPELTKRVGQPSEQWPLVVLKELVDNALDACEEVLIAPEVDIDVSTEAGTIVISDNGPGLLADTIAGITDYTVRTSSREAYASPTRGRQGNALQTICAMPFALHGTEGMTVIEARGQRHTIRFTMDRVRREPDIDRQTESSNVQIGTRITVHWPDNACHFLDDAKRRFVQLAAAFTTFNPHLTLRCRWNGEDVVDVVATTPAWRKWRACDPTSAYWYDRASFERYIAAHIARDQERGKSERTVRDFIKELRGLRRPDAQKLVLEETGSSRTPLAAYFAGGDGAIARLLKACQVHTESVKPKALGLIGEEHLLQDCISLGAADASFKYRKHLDTTARGLPYALEAAFAWCPEAEARQIISGINFSIALGDPFSRLGPFDTLHAVLAEQEIYHDDPVAVVLHYVSPVVDFSDTGKTTLTLPLEVGSKAVELIEAVTRDWAKQCRAEQRRASAEANRRYNLLKQKTKRPRQEPPQPTGALAEKITAAANELGVPVDSLAVLSPGADPYLAWRRRREAEWFVEVFNRFVEPDKKKHLRGLFYRATSVDDIDRPNGKRLINSGGHWQAFLKAASAARWLGLIPFNRIIDGRNPEARIYVPPPTPVLTTVSGGDECVIPTSSEDAMPSFSLDGFRGRQPHRLIFYGEKISLAEVLEPIAVEVGVDMVLVTGESSHTRLEEAIERASKDGRPAVLCYFADFDPAGHQMAVSVSRKVQALCDLLYEDLDIKIYRVALTIEQVRDLNLPSKPLKEKEKRAHNWLEKFGHEQTELDAMIELHPEALRDAVFDAIAPFYDSTLNQRIEKAEAAWREEAGAALRDHPEYGDLSETIELAYERVADAVEELHAEQQRATEILRDNLPEAPDLPEAAPTGAALPALFDSGDDFITATRRLIDDKKLADMDEADEDDDEC